MSNEARKPIISGNWKMNHNHFEAIQCVQKLAYLLTKDDFAAVDVTIHPPFTDLRSVQTLIDADELKFILGAQHCHESDSGAFTGEISSGVTVNDPQYVKDQRVGATFVLYPRPFGIQTEYNIGKGPRYNSVTNAVDETDLDGGYVLLNYKLDIKKQVIYPFAKFQYYDGGKKYEKDARSYVVRDYEFGVEWQFSKNFELVAMYTISNRRYEDFILRDNHQEGNLLRLQAQINF